MSDYKARVTRMYEAYAPSKVASVDATLEKYAGAEEQLLEALVVKYGPEPGEGSQSDVKARVTRMYEKYAPSKVASVDATLQKYAGAEEQLIEALVAKYGPEPGGQDTAATSPVGTSKSETAAPTPAVASGAAGEYRDRVTRMYEKYAPSKVASVDATLQKYAGAEEQLLEALVTKYGPEPEAGATPASPVSAVSPPPSANTSIVVAAPSDYRTRVTRMYEHYAPSKVASVDATLQKYAGAEEQLIEALVTKYGPEPSGQDVPPASPGVMSPASAASPTGVSKSEGNASFASGAAGEYRDRVARMYEKYAPSKVASVDATLQKYAGAEEQLLEALVTKYGPEPGPGSSAPAPTGSPSPPPSASTSIVVAAPSDYRTRVARMYEQYAPSKVASVDATLQKYAGAEEQLIEALVTKYGPEPSGQDVPPASPGVMSPASVASPTGVSKSEGNASFGVSAGGDAADFKGRVTRMYEQYAPSKVASVDATLQKYAGAEEQLIEALVTKYGPEPGAGVPTPVASSATPASPVSAVSPPPSANTSIVVAAPSDYRTRVTRMYEQYAPSKVASVDATLQKYAGAEEQLIEALVTKYGPEPSGQDVPPASPGVMSPASAASPTDVSKSEGNASFASGAAGEYRDRVTRMYEQYAPSKVASVDTTLQKYAGAEEQLLEALVAKYGPEPEAGATPASPVSAVSPPPSANASMVAAAPSDFRARVARMYEQYAPSKVGSVDATLQKYAGAEEQLIEALVTKYGPEPSGQDIPSSPKSEVAPSPTLSKKSSFASLPPSAPQPGSDVRARVTRMYEKYAPSKVASVDATLQKYAGAEEQLIEALVTKYGPEPGEATSPSPQPVAPSAPTFRSRIVRMYEKYAPAKVASADATLQKYAGAEEQLIEALVAKYGPEPPASAAPAAAETSPAATSPGPSPASSYRDRITRLYEAYAPAKVTTVDTALQKYAGAEEQLIEALVTKYGPEPPAVSAPSSPKAASPAASVSSTADMSPKARVTRMYEQYAPSKVASVDATLQKYAGAEEQLIEALVTKYGPEPLGDVAGSPMAEPRSPASETSAFSAAAQDTSHKARITRMYERYAPSKVASVDATLQKYAGAEEQLIEALVTKYGPEPGAVPTTPTSQAPGSPKTAPRSPTASVQSAHSARSAASATEPSYRDRVLRMYERYAPAKAGSVDATLQKYAGAEQQLIEALVTKYGPEPSADSTPASPKTPMAPPASFKARVTRMYEEYAPAKVGSVDATLQKYAGAEEQLIEALVTKYGPEPGSTTPKTPTTPATDATDMSYAARITRVYAAHAPDKLGSVPATLAKYKGAEEQLLQALVTKYGPEPSPAAGSPPGSPPAVVDDSEARAAAEAEAQAKVEADARVAAAAAELADAKAKVDAAAVAIVADLAAAFVEAGGAQISAAALFAAGAEETAALLALEAIGREAIATEAATAAPELVHPTPPFTEGDAAATFHRFAASLGVAHDTAGAPHIDGDAVGLLCSTVGVPAPDAPRGLSTPELRGWLAAHCGDEAAMLHSMAVFADAAAATAGGHDETDATDAVSAGRRKRSGVLQEVDLARGFWAHKCVFPVVVEAWTRVWMTAKDGRLLWYLPERTKPQGVIVLNEVVDARLTSMVPTQAPRHVAKNGMRMKLASGSQPVFLAVCPESMAAAHALVALARTHTGQAPSGQSTTPSRSASATHPAASPASPAAAKGLAVAELLSEQGVIVHVLRSGQRKWATTRWAVAGPHLVHETVAGAAQGARGHLRLADIVQLTPSVDVASLGPPVRSGGGRGCGFSLQFRDCDVLCCVERPPVREELLGRLRGSLLRQKMRQLQPATHDDPTSPAPKVPAAPLDRAVAAMRRCLPGNATLGDGGRGLSPLAY